MVCYQACCQCGRLELISAGKSERQCRIHPRVTSMKGKRSWGICLQHLSSVKDCFLRHRWSSISSSPHAGAAHALLARNSQTPLAKASQVFPVNRLSYVEITAKGTNSVCKETSWHLAAQRQSSNKLLLIPVYTPGTLFKWLIPTFNLHLPKSNNIRT